MSRRSAAKATRRVKRRTRAADRPNAEVRRAARIEAYRRKLAQPNRPMPEGKQLNLYVGDCGHFVVTRQPVRGVTPSGIRCGECGGWLLSWFGVLPDGCPEPTLEWYRPEVAELNLLARTQPGVVEHVAKGGLLLRPIPTQEVT